VLNLKDQERIFGEGGEIGIASWYMCSKCGEIFLNLDSLGYCIDIENDTMTKLLKEYHNLTGFERVSDAR
jgi:hypothetical protein